MTNDNPRSVNLDLVPVNVKPKPRWWEIRRRVYGRYLLWRFHRSVRRLQRYDDKYGTGDQWD